MRTNEIQQQDWRLRLEPKPLASGNCQLKFFAHRGEAHFYGYYLARPEQTMREVEEQIAAQLEQRLRYADRYHHQALFHLQRSSSSQYVGSQIIIYTLSTRS